MRLFNERYRVLKEIAETNNSISFLVEDKWDNGEKYFLKMLNTKNKNSIPLKLFKKEFLVNSIIYHKNLKKVYSFHTCYNIDNQSLSHPYYFYLSEYIENPKKIDLFEEDKIIYFNQIVNFITFLHNIDLYHGDLSITNLFVKNGEIKFHDISPYVQKKSGLQSDIKNLNNILRENFCDKTSYTYKSIEEFQNHAFYNKESQKDNFIKLINLYNIEDYYYPMSDIKEYYDKLIKNRILFFVNKTDIRNNYFITKKLLIYSDIDGYLKLIIKDNKDKEKFSLVKEMLVFYSKISDSRDFIERNRDYIDSYIYSGDESNLEESQKINFAYYVIKELVNIKKIHIWIENFKNLDHMSKKIINRINDIENILVTSNVFDTNTDYINCQIIDKLNFEDFKKLLNSVFYNIEVNNKKLLYDLVDGEIIFFHQGLKKLIEDKNFLLSKKISENLLKESFNAKSNLIDKIKNLNDKEFFSLLIICNLNNYRNIDFKQRFEKKFSTSLRNLEKNNLIIISKDTINLKYNFINNLLIENKRKIDLTEESYNDLFDIIKEYLNEDMFLLESISNIYNYFNYQEVMLNNLFIVIEDLKKKNPNSRYNYYYYTVLKRNEKFFKNLKKQIQFDYYYDLIKSNKRDTFFDIQYLLKKMKENIDNENNKYLFISAEFLYDKFDDKEILEKEKDLKKLDIEKFYNYRLYAEIVISYIYKLNDFGYHEKGLKLYKELIEPNFSKFRPDTIVKAYLQLEYMYSRLKDFTYSGNLFDKTLEIIDKYPEQIPNEMVFNLYNNLAINNAFRNNEKKGFYYFNKALDYAIKDHDFDRMALTYNNMGAINFWNGKREKSYELYQLSQESGKMSNNFENELLAVANLVHLHIKENKIRKAKVLIEDYEKRIDDNTGIFFKKEFFKMCLFYSFTVGDFKGIEKYLNMSERFFISKDHTLVFAIEYYSVKYIYLYMKNSQEDANNFLEEIKNNTKLFPDTKALISLYDEILDFCFLSEIQINKEIIKYVVSNFDKYMYTNNYNVKAKIILYALYFDVDMEKITGISVDAFYKKITFENLENDLSLIQLNYSLIEDERVKMLFFYVLFKKIVEKNSKKNVLVDIIQKEFLLKIYEKLYEFTYQGDMRFSESLIEHSPIFKFYYNFLDNNGIDFFNFKIQKFIEKNRALATEYIKKKRERFYRETSFSNIGGEEQTIKRILNDALYITCFKRGIYYRYNNETGWVKIYEVHVNSIYSDKVPIKDNVLNNLLLKKIDNVEFQYDVGSSEYIKYAIAFPMIDITINREKNRKSNSSYFKSLTIDGAFYFDTPYDILTPHKEDLQHLFFMREYCNLAIYYNKLRKSALQDSLTKLLKKEYWYDFVKNLFLKKQESKFAIIITDIDFFKKINDIHGHLKGDEVLANVAAIIKDGLRSLDIAGRYGGEEFVIALVDCDYNKAYTVIERIREKIMKTTLIEGNNITMSFGIAVYPEDGKLIELLIEKADKALLNAKDTGRNKTVKWNDIKNISVIENKKTKSILDMISRESDKINGIIHLINEININNDIEFTINKIYDLCHVFAKLNNIKIDVFEKSDFDNKIKKMSKSFFQLGHMEIDNFNIVFLLSTQLNEDNYDIVFSKQYYNLLANIILEKIYSVLLNKWIYEKSNNKTDKNLYEYIKSKL